MNDEPLVPRTAPLVQETPDGLRWLRIGALIDGTMVYERDETLERLAMTTTLKAPMPYFGGKSKIAPVIWERFGNPDNLVEPFFGSGAITLAAPWPADRTETVNDADGHLCNFWRAMRDRPDEVAALADYPVSELDLHARHRYLVDRRAHVEQMLADPAWCDVKLAAWWVWGISQWIGSGWCPTPPAGVSDVGHLPRKLPHVGNAGMGVHRAANAHAGLSQQVPDLSSTGRGIAAPRLARKRPHMGGVDTNADGTAGKSGGKGIFRTSLSRKMPHVGAGWNGTEKGEGVHRVTLAEEGNLVLYFRALSERLRRVRIVCGDWSRVCGPSVTWRHGTTAVFLDPPYVRDDRADVYAVEGNMFEQVRAWAIESGQRTDMRIALCGYETDDFTMPHGWDCFRWNAAGGYGSQGNGRGRENSKREVVWFSPHCLNGIEALPLFAQARED